MPTRQTAALALAYAFGLLACSSAEPALHADGGMVSTSARDASHDASPSADARAPLADAGQTLNAEAAGDPEIPSFAVGVTTRTWVDLHRATPQNGLESAKSSRTLVAEVWYPTAGAGASASPARDAPLLPGGPYPLVFFVHGSSSGRTVYTYLTIALAKAGYVVVAADFPLTALGTPGGPSDLGVSAQVGDLSFMCDQLKAAALPQDDALHGAIDGLHYAVVGHSTGGTVAALSAFAGDDDAIEHDARVSAIVPLSGDACLFDASFFKRRSVPVLAIGATNDLFVRIANNGQWLFDNTRPPHMLVKLVGGSHMGFTDVSLPDLLLNPVPTSATSPLATTLRAYGDASECTPVPPAGSDEALAFDAQHTLVVQWVTAFLEAQLRHRPAALAALVGANDPRVIVQH